MSYKKLKVNRRDLSPFRWASKLVMSVIFKDNKREADGRIIATL